MKLEKAQIQDIQSQFATIKSREDLLALLNSANQLLYGKDAKGFELKTLTYYANPKRNIKHYKTFQVKKKSGAVRYINAPQKGLKAIQKALNIVLQCVFEPHEAAMGFVPNRSIVDNAKAHVGSNYVFNLDLKDFFSSIDQARVWACLKLKPFNLIDDSDEFTPENLNTGIRKFTTVNGERILYKYERGECLIIPDKKGEFTKYKNRIESQKGDVYEDAKKYVTTEKNIVELGRLVNPKSNLANILAGLTSVQMEVERKGEDGEWVKVLKNVLPQGAPTSPVLSNIVCQRLDRRLNGVANRFGLKYTRYADDITFSSMHNVYHKNGAFLKEVEEIINGQGFSIKSSKTRLQKEGYRKEVTGLTVNNKVNVQKRYTKQIRMWLYYWETYGYNKAEQIFTTNYLLDKGHVKKGKPNFMNVLSGKLEYYKMVKSENDDTYIKLKERYDALVSKQSHLTIILDVWEKEGIEKAMNLFCEKPNKYL